ncbi:MAG TPA: DNA-3-methyladenine glycosylase I [Vicinamibacterales bacterium]|nr:DNA-3-methyladenine glycosylase I [Vicinamibacterales bacterium]
MTTNRDRTARPRTVRSRVRCMWAGGDPLMCAYHDDEWGVPERDPRMLWETLMLEGFQAGLSWAIVLRKRDGFRRAFAGFDPDRVARFTPRDVDRLVQDPTIIRVRAKIEATITGARIFCAMRDRGEDFAAWAWAFTDDRVVRGNGRHVPSETPLSVRVSRELKQRGFKFVGPTIVYAWMQAVGIVNDHQTTCFRRGKVDPRSSRSRR